MFKQGDKVEVEKYGELRTYTVAQKPRGNILILVTDSGAANWCHAESARKI